MTESNRTTSAVLTVDEAAALLRISRQSAYAAVHAGELPTVKIGRRILVPRARLLALLGEDLPEGNDPATNGAARHDRPGEKAPGHVQSG